jgi:hypothetical protein
MILGGEGMNYTSAKDWCVFFDGQYKFENII